MKIETAFTPGGAAFILVGDFCQQIAEYTVGQVRIEVTDSPGLPGDATIDGIRAREFSNYAPQSEYKEQIMCVETGVGSGTIYTYGEHAFTSMESAERGREAMAARHAERIAAQEKWKREQQAQDLEYHRRKLAELEGSKLPD